MAEQMVTVPGIMGQMPLATAQAAGYTDYTPVAPLAPVNVSLPPPPEVAAPAYVPPPTVVAAPAPEGSIAWYQEQGVPLVSGGVLTQSEVAAAAVAFSPVLADVTPITPVDYSPPMDPFSYIAPLDIPVSVPSLGAEEKKFEEEEEKKKTILGTAADAVAELNASPIAKLVGAGAALAGVNPNPVEDMKNTPIGQLAAGGVFTGSLGIGLAGPSAPVVNTPVVNPFSGVVATGSVGPDVVSTPVVDKGFFGNIAAAIQGMAEAPSVSTPKVTTPVISGPAPISAVLGSSFVNKPETIQVKSIVEPGLVQSALNQWMNKSPTVELGPPVLISPNLSSAITPDIWKKVVENKPWVNAPPSDLSFGTWLKSDTTGSNIMKAAMAVAVVPVVAGAVITAPIWAPIAVPVGATVLKTGAGLVFGSGTAALVTGGIQNLVSPQRIDTIPYEAPVAKTVAIQDKWKDIQVSTDASGARVVEVAPVQAKAYQDAVAEANSLQSGLDKWKQYEFLAADGTVKLNITDEQFGQYKNELAAADAAVNKAKGLFEVYKVNSDRLFGQYSSDMASLSGQIPDKYKSLDGTINVSLMIKDMGEANALSTLAAAGQRPAIAGEIYDKLSPEAKALYTRGNVSTSAQSGLLGAWGRGVETLYEPVSGFLEQHTPTLPVVGNLASGVWNYLVPQQLASQLYEQKGSVGMTALIPHFGATVAPVALNWDETSNLNKAMGIGFAASPWLVGPMGSVLGKAGQVVSKIPVIGPVAKVVGGVVTAPIKVVEAASTYTGLSQYGPWRLAQDASGLLGSAGLKNVPKLGEFGTKVGWWNQTYQPVGQMSPALESAGLQTRTVTTTPSKVITELKNPLQTTRIYEPVKGEMSQGASPGGKYSTVKTIGLGEVKVTEAKAQLGGGKIYDLTKWREAPGILESKTGPLRPEEYPTVAEMKGLVEKYGTEYSPVTGEVKFTGEGWKAPTRVSEPIGVYEKAKAPSVAETVMGKAREVTSPLMAAVRNATAKLGTPIGATALMAAPLLSMSVMPSFAAANLMAMNTPMLNQAQQVGLYGQGQLAQNVGVNTPVSGISQVSLGINQPGVSINQPITGISQGQQVSQGINQNVAQQGASIGQVGVVEGQGEVGIGGVSQGTQVSQPITQMSPIQQVSLNIPSQTAIQGPTIGHGTVTQVQQIQAQLNQADLQQQQIQNELQQLQEQLQTLVNQENTLINQEQVQAVQDQIQQLQQANIAIENFKQEISSTSKSVVTPVIPPIFPPLVGTPRQGEGWGGGFGGLLKGGIGTWVTRGYSMVGINPLTGKVIKYQALKKGIRYGNVQKRPVGQPTYKVVRV